MMMCFLCYCFEFVMVWFQNVSLTLLNVSIFRDENINIIIIVQILDQVHFAVDTTPTSQNCEMPGLRIAKGANSEDNWGYYGNTHDDFSCTETASSTTNVWFQISENPGSTKYNPSKSCLDIQKGSNNAVSGWYWIELETGTVLPMYCDMASSPPWVLVESFAFSKGSQKYNTHLQHPSLVSDVPRNVNGRDVSDYRLSKSNMINLLASSGKWRSTCNMDTSMNTIT